MIKSSVLIAAITNSYFGFYPQMTGPISRGAVQRSFSEEFLTCLSVLNITMNPDN